MLCSGFYISRYLYGWNACAALTWIRPSDCYKFDEIERKECTDMGIVQMKVFLLVLGLEIMISECELLGLCFKLLTLVALI